MGIYQGTTIFRNELSLAYTVDLHKWNFLSNPHGGQTQSVDFFVKLKSYFVDALKHK